MSLAQLWLNDLTTGKIIDYLERYRSQEDYDLARTVDSLEKELKGLDIKLDRLLDGYINGLISPDEYQKKKESLVE